MGIIDSIKKLFGGKDTAGTATESPPAEQKQPDSFYIDTIEFQRAQKDQFFRTNPHSPIADQANFEGLDYYPPDPDMRMTLPLEPAEDQEPLTMETSTGDEQTFYRLGTVEFEIEGEPAQLTIYQSAHHDELFLPFRDATSGNETYGAGRYLEPERRGDDQILVDFNLSYNPFCAYSEHYSCPLPPFENHLQVPIRAGEKAYHPAENE